LNQQNNRDMKLQKIKYTLWFNKLDLTVRNEKLMNNIYPVDEYVVEDNLEMLSITFNAFFVDRVIIMNKALENGACIVSIGSY